VIDPKPDCAAASVAEVHGVDFDDAVVPELLAGCDAVTWEFENVPVSCVERLARVMPVFPDPEVLGRTQDRLHEKALLSELGIPVPQHASVDSMPELEAAAESIGLPAVLKTRRMGYDGRGQRMLRSDADLRAAWAELGGVPLILEERIDFDREVSILAVRSRSGEIRYWPITENRHVDGVLRISRAPAECEATMQERGRRWVADLLNATGYVGVVAVELFVRGDELIANEIACRVHNSGHWTDVGAATSQFENHMRAVAGLPLGSTSAIGCAGMINLIGTLPEAQRLLDIPRANVHLYGKQPSPGRKLGHVTVRATDPCDLEVRLLDAVQRIGEPVTTSALEPVAPIA
jgi:5-(carboxyamino)imidazole ribonucleotide synthase